MFVLSQLQHSTRLDAFAAKDRRRARGRAPLGSAARRRRSAHACWSRSRDDRHGRRPLAADSFIAPMPLFARGRAERELQRKAEAFVAVLFREPDPADVQWLAEAATRGDTDHALWELRYARRALGLIAAQRDALDDRTASV